MATKISNQGIADATHFQGAPVLSNEFSRMEAPSRVLTAFNAGRLVPIKVIELAPHESINRLAVRMDVRASSPMPHPVLDDLMIDLYAFFVPHRVVNESFVNVMGENSAGAGIAPEIALAPLVMPGSSAVKVPVNSVADYYGYPSQASIPSEVLCENNDLEFRGYLSIYNEYFRDQNYQPPIVFSKLNVFEGFFLPKGSSKVNLDGSTSSSLMTTSEDAVADGSFADGAIIKALYGEGASSKDDKAKVVVYGRRTDWSALDEPLKVNKFHDPFTSSLPFVQKGASLAFLFPSEAKVLPLTTSTNVTTYENDIKFSSSGLSFSANQHPRNLIINPTTTSGVGKLYQAGDGAALSDFVPFANDVINGSNLVVNLPQGALGSLDISQMRTAIATQQVYELLARAGSRYRSFLAAFFGLDDPDPFRDMPRLIGHTRRSLTNYQVAQTSGSMEGADGSKSSQGQLAAFSYTEDNGVLIDGFTADEDGYVHILAVIRQKNIYSTYLAPRKFRRKFMDWYLPQLANISEQPVYSVTLNPFKKENMSHVFGYQEAWWDYRYEPDTTSSVFRSGIPGFLTGWAYVDKYTDRPDMVTSKWLESNAQELVDETLTVQSSQCPQFLALFRFNDDKTFPGPTFSVPGLDVF